MTDTASGNDMLYHEYMKDRRSMTDTAAGNDMLYHDYIRALVEHDRHCLGK